MQTRDAAELALVVRDTGTTFIFQGLIPPHKSNPDRELSEKEREEARRFRAGQRWFVLADKVSRKVNGRRRDGSERMPEHAAAMVAEGHLRPEDFVLAGSMTDPSRIRVGHTDLATLPTLPPDEQWAAVAAAAEGLPEGVVAHRLGDFVFTYHGVRSAVLPIPRSKYGYARLWKAIASPDPDFNETMHGEFRELTEILGTNCPRLDEQNGLRVFVGLAPIPDPDTVRAGEPAAAPGNALHAAFVRRDHAP